MNPEPETDSSPTVIKLNALDRGKLIQILDYSTWVPSMPPETRQYALNAARYVIAWDGDPSKDIGLGLLESALRDYDAAIKSKTSGDERGTA